MTAVIFIHGAGASHRSFNWIIDQIPQIVKPLFFSYKMDSDISTCIKQLNELIYNTNKPITVIGHSLGGLIAAGVCENPFVERIITISAPLGGILNSGILGYMLSQDMLKDLLPYSSIMRIIQEKNKQSKKIHRAIVTTHGLTKTQFLESDGVVSVRSQTYWTTPIYTKFDLNHFEVLLDEDVVNYIRGIII